MNSGELFQDSYERASGQTVDGQDFFTHFYTVFLAADKAVAEKFINTDMAHQKSMLKKSFYSLYSFHISTNTDYLLEKIARKHGKGNMNISPV
ncbi:MAG: globin, partial [Pseudomonadales bacterium]